MKKFVSVICILALLTSCTSGNAGGTNGTGNEDTPPALSGEVTGEITVSCYDTMTYKPFLEEAAALFEAEYPGTKINIETASKMPEVKTMEQDGKQLMIMTKDEDDGTAINDYISKTNTELMGGGGADIIAMDVLPYINYSANGQLLDLKPFMEQDDEWSDSSYLDNVIDAVKYNNGQYILPLNYSFNYLVYDNSLISNKPDLSTNTLGGLIDSGMSSYEEINSSSENHISMFSYADDVRQKPNMFSALLYENYTDFINVATKTVNLADGKFAELLETVKTLGETGVIKHATPVSPDKMPDLSSLEKMREEKYMFKQKPSAMLFTDYDKNSNRQMFMAGAGSSVNDDIIGVSESANGNVPFTFSQAFGINSNTKNAETAWAFIKFLAGKEMQTSLNLRDLPINNEARTEKARMSMTGELYAGRAGNQDMKGSEIIEELDEDSEKVLAEYTGAVEQFSAKINSYIIQDTTVTQMIDQEVGYFFDGTKSANEVAEVLQNKIELYLNE